MALIANSTLIIFIAVLVSLAAGVAIGRLSAELKNMRQRIANLEGAQAKHLPYKTAEELENTIAALLVAKFKLDFNQEIIDNALAHAQKARNGRNLK